MTCIKITRNSHYHSWDPTCPIESDFITSTLAHWSLMLPSGDAGWRGVPDKLHSGMVARGQATKLRWCGKQQKEITSPRKPRSNCLHNHIKRAKVIVFQVYVFQVKVNETCHAASFSTWSAGSGIPRLVISHLSAQFLPRKTRHVQTFVLVNECKCISSW